MTHLRHIAFANHDGADPVTNHRTQGEVNAVNPRVNGSLPGGNTGGMGAPFIDKPNQSEMGIDERGVGSYWHIDGWRYQIQIEVSHTQIYPTGYRRLVVKIC